MLRRFVSILLLASAGVFACGAARAAVATCTQFKEAMVRGAAEMKPEFVRPLVVSRGADAGLDQYDLVSQARIDGVLRCRGEVFASFEAKITLPADAPLLARFEKTQQVALVAALNWPMARAETKVKAMTVDAVEYLRASVERGDVYVSGKVEEHEPDFVDLGLIWTQTDRTFVLLVGS